MIAKGTFVIKLTPEETKENYEEHLKLSRMSFTKEFSGDLSGTGKGEMLNLRSPTEGSAGYVALETITVTLGEKSGSFAMQHFGIMQAGTDSSQIIKIIPDSGTEGLKGISGELLIDIKEGVHFYSLNYTL